MNPRADSVLVSAWDSAPRVFGWLRATGVHGVWIGVWSVVGVTGTIAAPALLGHPVLLMLLSPRAVFVALAAKETSLVALVVLGLFRLSIADLSYFVLGRRAEATLAIAAQQVRARRWWSPAAFGDRCARALCRSRTAAALVLFLRPSGRYLGVAGAYGVPTRLAALASVGGTVVYLIAMHQGAKWLIG